MAFLNRPLFDRGGGRFLRQSDARRNRKSWARQTAFLKSDHQSLFREAERGALLFAAIGALLLFNLLAQAFLLWLSCRVCGVKRPGAEGAPLRVSYRRALGITLGLAQGNVALAAAFYFVQEAFELDLSRALLLLACQLVLWLTLLFAFLRLGASATVGQTFLVALLLERARPSRLRPHVLLRLAWALPGLRGPN